MHPRLRWCALIAPLWFSPCAVAGLESQALRTVESLPATVVQVFACGAWAERGQRGHDRIVLAEVSGGAGTEVYVQRLRESMDGANRVLHVVATIPVRELNDDHAQYRIFRARCVGDRSVELRATYEHDEGDVERHITLVITAAGGYRIGNAVVPAIRRASRRRVGTTGAGPGP